MWIDIYTPCLKKTARITALQDPRTITLGGVKSPYAGVAIDSGGSAAYGGHKGIDFGVGTGTPVYAPVAGSVWTTYYTTGGNRLLITMPDGTGVGFNHLSKFARRSGWVNKGDLVAYSGNTGTATTGPHLHVDVFRDNGKCLDCWPYAIGNVTVSNAPEYRPKKTNTIYRVQIGAYTQKDNAYRQQARAKAGGFGDAFIVQGTDAFYRVQIGAYSVKDNAYRQQARARQAGFNGAFIQEVSA